MKGDDAHCAGNVGLHLACLRQSIQNRKEMGLVSGLMMDQVEDPAIVLLDDLERLFQFGLTFFLFHLSEGFL